MYGCKKGFYGYYVIQSSNHQKSIEEKILSKCDVIIFIKHLCTLNKYKVFKFLSFKAVRFWGFEALKF